MRRARLLPAAALAALLLLAGCAAEAPDDAEPPASSGTAAPAVDDAPDADQTNGLVPAGYPEGFDCEGIGPLISGCCETTANKGGEPRNWPNSGCVS